MIGEDDAQKTKGGVLGIDHMMDERREARFVHIEVSVVVLDGKHRGEVRSGAGKRRRQAYARRPRTDPSEYCTNRVNATAV
jgi:hypothetical protein